MMNKSKVKQFLGSALAVAGFVLLSGVSNDVLAQRDPFEKSPLTRPRIAATATTAPASAGTVTVKAEKPKPAGPPPIVPLGAPPIEQRINYYKQLREDAAASGQEIPKVTSVLTLDEMSVIGIFRTPRGYAAMVQATPINLSYTIYPGEKFFDGQLVAVEENRLVFRKVAKLSNGKFTASVQNKTLRQYSVQEQVQGTAPIQPTEKTERTAEQPTTVETAQPSADQRANPIIPTVGTVISPLEEMLKQPAEQPKDTAKKAGKDKNTKSVKKGKKPVKVAENKNQ